MIVVNKEAKIKRINDIVESVIHECKKKANLGLDRFTVNVCVANQFEELDSIIKILEEKEQILLSKFEFNGNEGDFKLFTLKLFINS